MHAVFYFAGRDLSTFVFKGKELVDIQVFVNSEEGLDRFSEYTSLMPKMSVRILIDIIEEDFRRDTAPAAFGQDGKLILKRAADRAFRGIRRKIVRRIGKTTGPSKKQLLHMSALSNNELMSSWLHILHKNKIAIQSITSVPYAGELLLDELKVSADRVLLLSQQVVSGIRFSYYENNSLRLSRVATAGDDVNLDGQFILQEIDKNLRYMRNQKWLGAGDEIKVLVLVNSASETRLYELVKERHPELAVTLLDKLDVCKRLSLICQSEYSSSVYIGLLAKKHFSKPHYATPKDLRFYRHFIIQRLVNLLSLAMVALSVGLFAYGFYKYNDLIDEEKNLIHAQSEVQNKMDSVDLSIRNDLPKPQLLKNSVDVIQDVTRKPTYDQSEIINSFSSVLSLNENVVLSSFFWSINDNNIFDFQGGSVKPQPLPKKDLIRLKNTQGYVDAWYEAMLINGLIDSDISNPRAGVDIFDRFIDQLKQDKHVTSLVIIKKPFVIQQAESVSGQLNTVTTEPIYSRDFSLQIVRRMDAEKPPSNR